jgi:hypothetical protein
MSYTAGHQYATILIDKNADVSILQTSLYYATIFCRDSFTINEGASVYVGVGYRNTEPLVRFTTNNSKFIVSNPKSVVFYNRGQSVFRFYRHNKFFN